MPRCPAATHRLTHRLPVCKERSPYLLLHWCAEDMHRDAFPFDQRLRTRTGEPFLVVVRTGRWERIVCRVGQPPEWLPHQTAAFRLANEMLRFDTPSCSSRAM